MYIRTCAPRSLLPRLSAPRSTVARSAVREPRSGVLRMAAAPPRQPLTAQQPGTKGSSCSSDSSLAPRSALNTEHGVARTAWPGALPLLPTPPFCGPSRSATRPVDPGDLPWTCAVIPIVYRPAIIALSVAYRVQRYIPGTCTASPGSAYYYGDTHIISARCLPRCVIIGSEILRRRRQALTGAARINGRPTGPL